MTRHITPPIKLQPKPRGHFSGKATKVWA